MKKIVIFGAGRIGRSFIGQLFSRGGYEVVFIDIDHHLIDLLNKHKCYKIIIKGESDDLLLIRNIRGIHFEDTPQILNELSSTTISAVSVGQAGLPSVIPLIAKCLQKRADSANPLPLDIILAENMRDAARYFSTELIRLLGQDFPLKKMAGLIETSIGKMVPFMTSEDLRQDPLQIFAEPYNTLILDKKAFLNPVPDIQWLAPKENMKAWVDRKSFIHNLGHAAAAYTGFLKHPGKLFLYEILDDPEIYQVTRQTMQQSSSILMKIHPGEFTIEDLESHIDDLLSRFRSKALRDTVFRVGCDLIRKLGLEDRLVAPITEALRISLPYDKILYALVCGFYFKAKDDSGRFHPSDLKFYDSFKPDIGYLMSRFCGLNLNNNKKLFNQAREFCIDINHRYDPEVKIS
jgi:mannitol-1-phosphate 5-dehydrogenase